MRRATETPFNLIMEARAIGAAPIGRQLGLAPRLVGPAEHHERAGPLVAAAGAWRAAAAATSPSRSPSGVARAAARSTTAATIGLPAGRRARPANAVGGVLVPGQHRGLGPERGVPRPPHAVVDGVNFSGGVASSRPPARAGRGAAAARRRRTRRSGSPAAAGRGSRGSPRRPATRPGRPRRRAARARWRRRTRRG